MNAYISYLNDLLNGHKLAYKTFPSLRWLNPYEAVEYQQQRDALMQGFEAAALFKGTKPYLNTISPGCKLCGQGLWSCLFITGKCNAACFYCPALQKEDHLPTSQGLHFESPEAYAEYINYFGFKGVSFSGGEPLLVKTRTLAYLKELRKRCDKNLYIWMYTNGLAGTREIYKQLGDAGLNEVRFDIGATAFSLDKIYQAKGEIENITIEIPAVPEEKERLKALLHQFSDAGVSRLNLHQMRLTPYNAPRLSKRQYTYIAAERPIVLESELAALEIMEYAKQQQLDIGINYCSFYFKYRFQKAGFRKMIHQKIEPDAKRTECNYIRRLDNDYLEYQSYLFADKDKLQMDARKLHLSYKTYDYQKVTAFKTELNNRQYQHLFEKEPASPPQQKTEFDIWQFEYIEPGLRDY